MIRRHSIALSIVACAVLFAAAPCFAEWEAQVDAVQGEGMPDRVAKRFAVTVGGSTQCLFPSLTPSRFVGVANARNERGDRVAAGVLDIRSGQLIAGFAPGNEAPQSVEAVSPDGRHLVGRHFGKMHVWSTRTGEDLGEIDEGEVLGFRNETELIIIDTGKATAVKLFDVSKMQTARSIAIDEPLYKIHRAIMTVSPGGRYLLLAGKHRILIDLEAGAVLGKLEGTEEIEKHTPGRPGRHARVDPDEVFYPTFSPDGTEIAVTRHAPGRGMNNTRPPLDIIYIYDAATGKLREAAHIQLWESLLNSNIRKTYANDYDGPSLYWLPDGKGWLLNDRYFADRVSGRVVMLAQRPEDGLFDIGWVFVNADMALIARKTPNSTSYPLECIDMSDKQIDAMFELVRSGSFVGDKHLPPVVKIDTTTARDVQVPKDDVPWTFVPPAAADDKAEPVNQPHTPVDATAFLQARGTILADAGCYVARDSASYTSFGRYSLADGSPTGRISLPFIATVRDIAPDGSALLLQTRDEWPFRFVIWKFNEKAASIAFTLTYDRRDPIPPRMNNYDAWWVDENHVMVADGTRHYLHLVNVAQGNVIYRVNFDPPLRTSGRSSRRYLIFDAGQTPRLFDAVEGKLLGNLPEQRTSWQLSPDCRYAAWGSFSSQAASVGLIDLATGKQKWQAGQERNDGTMVAWCGSRYLLLGNRMLIDVERGVPVHGWTYPENMQVQMRPDPATGRIWMFIRQLEPLSAPVLFEPTLVTPEIQQREPLTREQAYIVNENGPYSLNVTTDRPAYHAKLVKAVTEKLNQRGIQVVDGAPVTFTYAPSFTGRVVQYYNAQRTQFALPRLVLKTVVTHKGQELGSYEQEYSLGVGVQWQGRMLNGHATVEADSAEQIASQILDLIVEQVPQTAPFYYLVNWDAVGTSELQLPEAVRAAMNVPAAANAPDRGTTPASDIIIATPEQEEAEIVLLEDTLAAIKQIRADLSRIVGQASSMSARDYGDLVRQIQKNAGQLPRAGDELAPESVERFDNLRTGVREVAVALDKVRVMALSGRNNANAQTQAKQLLDETINRCRSELIPLCDHFIRRAESLAESYDEPAAEPGEPSEPSEP